MKRVDVITFLITIMIFCSIVDLSANEMDQDNYIDYLIDQIDEKNLAKKRYWHLLLHYKKNIFGSYESEEDGPNFFNSPIGKTDPQAELIATIKSFFIEPGELKHEEEHPQCNFPARYKWLKAELSFNPKKLPEQRCDRLKGWLEGLDPEKITLVFASYYMNNPASMFGHTLLRIDKKREGPQQKLLNYGVNYAATVDTGNALSYVFKGLFGMFRGTFSIFPYYTKVQEYSNWESRDLWEYELNFTEDQINYFLLHLWELGGNYFDYFYFQENCSYHLLSLLEVADPNLQLTDQFLFHVIPADTIKALTHSPGLISERVYRPSLLSQMNNKRLRMTKKQENLFFMLAEDPSSIEKTAYSNLSVPEKALVLDAYLDYTQYKTVQKEKTTMVIDKTTRKILLERSRLNYQSNDPHKAIQFSSPPELGHGSARVGLGVGRFDNELFQQISIRPAYHDLLAKDLGYGKDSQILFLDVTARYYSDIDEAKLDNLKVIDIISLTPYDPLFQKMSWKLGFGVDTIKDIECGLCNSYKANYGLGLTYKLSYSSPILFYALADIEAELSSHLDAYYRAGGGGTLGGLLDITENWRVQILGNVLKFPLGHQSHYYKASFNQRYAFTQNLDIRLELSKLKSEEEWLVSVNYYF